MIEWMGPSPFGLWGWVVSISASMVAGDTWCIAGSKLSVDIVLIDVLPGTSITLRYPLKKSTNANM